MKDRATDFGASLRALRRRTGLTQQQVAALTGLSQSHISRLERDGSATARPEALVRLASVLGVDPSGLFPEPGPWRTAEPLGESAGASFRLGFWECPATAPALLAAGRPGAFAVLLSRASQIAPVDEANQETPTLAADRPLTPRELVRALEASALDGVLIPEDAVPDHRFRLFEVAETAGVRGPVHIAAAISRRVPGVAALAARWQIDVAAPRGATAWEEIRDMARRGTVVVYFPSDTGAIGTVHDLRARLGERIEVRTIAPGNWPAFWSAEGPRLGVDRAVALAVAIEPYLSKWRSVVVETGEEIETSLVLPTATEDAERAPVVSFGIYLLRDRVTKWITEPAILDLLEELERRGGDLRRRSPQALSTVAARLGLDISTVVSECDACHFRTRYTADWVTRLRALAVVHGRATSRP